MPARLAILATARGGYPKGAIISAVGGSTPLGNAITLPGWVIVNVSDATYKQVAPYVQPIYSRARFTVESSTPSSGDYRIRLETEAGGPIGGIKRDAIQSYLDDWNAVYVSHDDRSVLFDWNLFDGVSSPGFWDRPVGAVVFINDGYTGGDLTMRIDYSATSFPAEEVDRQCRNRKLDVIDNAAGVCTVLVEPQDLRDDFLREVTNRVEVKPKNGKRRYAITEAGVDAIVGAGGEVTRTRAQLLPFIVDLNG